MKLVREHIEFTRGESPFKTLNIGKRAQIENWFETWVTWLTNANYEIDDDLNVRVKGSLNLNRSKVNSLPDNLHIDGFLNLYRSKIISLPDNLYVKGWLDIEETKITFLPNDLIVYGEIFKNF